MKLLIAMNLSPRWVENFSSAGVVAVHWSNLGLFNAPDSEIMAYARTSGFVVLTHDLDLGAILAATRGEKPSVVEIHADDVSPTAIGAQVIAALRQMATELENGTVLTGRFARQRGAVDVGNVMREIDDSRTEEAARRLRMQTAR